MKNIKFKLFAFSLLIAFGSITISCVDDDFGVPQAGPQEPVEIDGTVLQIGAVLGEIAQNDGEIQTLTFFEDTYVEGYVVSSDEGGNFFKELWIQDKPENPTAAIRIAIDIASMFGTYNVGRRIYVKLDGLSVGLDSGNPSIGIANGDRIFRIPQAQARNAIVRDAIVEEIVAKEVTMSEINRSMLGQYIKFTKAQFDANLILQNLTFAGETTDEFDAERTLQDCSSDGSVQLGTSTFSDFKGLRLPSDAGEVSGVLLRAFGDENYLFKLNSVEDINFNQDRCDLCVGLSGGTDVIFEEDFEGITNISQLTGWINVNTAGGTVNWRTGSFSGNTYAQVSGFNSGQTYDAWLVTPEINLSGSTLEEYSMSMEAAFDNGFGLEVLITENFTGDVLTTEWVKLRGISVPQGPEVGFGGLSPAGNVNISCLENIRFAFRYQGSDPDGVTTRYHIDNLRIVGQNN